MTQVKNLDWKLFWKQDEGHREYADTPFGKKYHVSAEGWWRIFEPLRPCDGLEAAKAAAQEDFRLHVMNCLVDGE